MRLFLALVFALTFCFEVALANSGPQGFNVRGVVRTAAGVPLEKSVNIKLQVFDKDAGCLLYEESHSGVDLSDTDGAFSLALGSGGGRSNKVDGTTALKANVFRNDLVLPTSSTCSGGLTTAAGDARMLRIIIDQGAGEVTMTPDLVIQSSPYANVAESLQGKLPADFLQLGSGSLTQANAESVFSTTNFPKLGALLAGTSTEYIRSTTTGAALPTFAADPVTPPAGAIWYDSTNNQLKYQSNLGAQVLGTSSGGVTGIIAGSGLAGGTITGSGTISLSATGVAAGTYTKTVIDTFGRVTSGTILSASDIPSLDASAIATGTIAVGRLPSGLSPWTVSGSDVYRASGNVGIGTTAPGVPLDVNGAARVNGRLSLASNTSIYGHAGYPNFLMVESTGTNENTHLVVRPNTNGTSASIGVWANGIDGTTAQALFGVNNGLIHLGAAFMPMPLDFQQGGTSAIRIATDGSIGIGTTAPATKLDVNGAIKLGTGTCGASTQGSLQFSGGNIQFCNTSNAWTTLSAGGSSQWNNGASSSINYTAGNVGIGTTAPSAPLQVSKAQASATLVDVTNSNPGGIAGFTATSDADQLTMQVLGSSAGSQGQIVTNANELVLNNADASGRIGLYVNTLPAMMIDSSRNVGIGTTTPAAQLEVAKLTTGGASTVTASHSFLFVQPPGVSSSTFNALVGAAYVGNGSPSGSVTGVAGWAEHTSSGAVNRLRSVYSGASNSGSGTVADATGGQFEVFSAGTGSISRAYGIFTDIVNSSGAIGTGYGVYVGPVQATNKYSVYASDVSAWSYFAGAVGIGTSLPQAALDVNGAIKIGSGTCSALTQGSIQFSGGVIQYCNTSNVWTTLSSGGSSQWNNGASSSINYLAGNVGIGTSVPLSPLDVNGAAIFRTTAVVGGTAVIDPGVINPALSVYGNLAIDSGGWTVYHLGGLRFYCGPDGCNGNMGSPQTFTLQNSGGYNLAVGGNGVFSGTVGIGTTAPEFPLHVAGSGLMHGRIESTSGATELDLYSYGASAQSTLFLSRGRGTKAAPSYLLAGDNVGYLGASPHQSNEQAARIMFNAAANWASGNTPGEIILATTPSGTAIPSNRMWIKEDGYVGINTGSPQAQLDVSGGIRVGDMASCSSASNAGTIRFNGGALQFCAAAGNTWTTLGAGGAGDVVRGGNTQSSGTMVIGTNDAFPLALETNGTNRLVVDTSGQVGIGTTGQSAKFSVGGAASDSAYFFFDNAAVGDAVDGQSFYVYRRAAEGDDYLRIYTDQGRQQILAPSNNLVIDMANGFSTYYRANWPSTYAASETTRWAPDLSTTWYTNSAMGDGTGSQLGLMSYNSSGTLQAAFVGAVANNAGSAPSIVFSQKTGATAHEERMRIDGSGRVGIGTTSPTDNLQVAGVKPAISLRDTGVGDNNSGGDLIFHQDKGNVTFNNERLGALWFAGTDGAGGREIGAGVTAYASAGWGANGLAKADLVFATSNADGMGPTERMRLNAGGALGIQTNDPQATLDVNGGVRIGAEGACVSATNAGTVQFNGGVLQFCAAAGNTWTTLATGSGGDVIRGGNTQAAGTMTVGTNDAFPLALEVNGTNRLFIDTNGKIGVGTTGPGYKLEISGTATPEDSTFGINGEPVVYLPEQTAFLGSIFFGTMSTTLSNTAGQEGQYNTAVGMNSLSSLTTGAHNTAVGASSLFFTGVGRHNTALGSFALLANISGEANTAVGYQSMVNTAGNNNTAVGASALLNNVGKTESTAMGYRAMYYADSTATTAVSYNTAVGAFALRGSSTAASNTGTRNTALGHSALFGVTSGTANIAVGVSAGSALTSGSGNVIIGADTGSSIATSSNNILLSDGSGNRRLTINSSGQVGIGNTAPRGRLSFPNIASATPGLTENNIIFWESGAETYGIGVSPYTIDIAANAPGGQIAFYSGNTTPQERVRITNTGNVGIGTTAPATALDVAGDVKLGSSGAACAASNEGAQRYNSTSKEMEYCNGTAWASLVPSGTWCGDSLNGVLCKGVNPSASCPSGYTQRQLTDVGAATITWYCSKN